MITGRIDEFGRALIEISVRASGDGPAHDVEVWIDTGFTGELVVPQSLVQEWGLPESAMVAAALADGTQNVLLTYSCVLDWFCERKAIEVIASEGRIPLLGVGLLLGHRLIADYDGLTLTVE